MICAVLLGAFPARAQEACAPSAQEQLPSRAPDAIPGSAFARRVASMTESEREKAIRGELLAGNVPSFIRIFTPVRLQATLACGRTVHVTACVSSDYLAIGSDRDFLFVPMRLATALAVATRYGFTLPTSRLVDAIYAQAAIRLSPQPLPAGDQMRSTPYYLRHTELIEAQRASLGARLGLLTSGHKKDVVITGRLSRFPDRVAIYGWHRATDSPIQPLSTVHGANYADYSHGVRLVSSTVLVDGAAMPMFDVLADPDLSRVLNGDGPIANLRQLLDVLAQPRQLTIAMFSGAMVAGPARWRDISGRAASRSSGSPDDSSRGCEDPSRVSRASTAHATGTNPRARDRCRR